MTITKKEAWKEILVLTNEDINPHWFEDSELIERHKKLIKVVDPETQWKKILSKEQLRQQYLDKREGLEDKVRYLLEMGKYPREVCRELHITNAICAFVRQKYGIELPNKSIVAPAKNEIERLYFENGVQAIAEHYNVSKTVAYRWLKELEISKPRRTAYE